MGASTGKSSETKAARYTTDLHTRDPFFRALRDGFGEVALVTVDYVEGASQAEARKIAHLLSAAPGLAAALEAIEGETELTGEYAVEVVLDSIRCLAQQALALARGEG